MKKYEYLRRWLAPKLKKSIEHSPVTVVTGARQVGKTTLLQKELGPEWRYLTLDDVDLLDQANRNPGILLSVPGPVVIDEVQRAPKLFLSIKQWIDEDRSRRVVLSGSANLLLMNKVSESLAGRAAFLELGPLSRGEILGYEMPRILVEGLQGTISEILQDYPSCSEMAEWCWQGGMPAVLLEEDTEALLAWRDGYVQTYLERDLRQLSQIENLPDFRRLMVASALRCGQILNTSALARDISLKQPTAHRYLGVLELSGLVYRLPAYAVNRGLRLVKSPKLMWVDSGLASHLAGHYSPEALLESREWGGILECFIFTQLRQLCNLLTPRCHIYYWRTSSGQEVDFVIEQGQTLLAIEVKGSRHVSYADTKGLQSFLETYPNTRLAIIFYAGDEVKQLAEKLFALPMSSLFR